MYNVKQFNDESKQIEEWLSQEYSQIHTGRAAPSLLDGVRVESYGAYQPLKNVASINIEDPKTLRISPWDKGQIKDIERALYASDLGFSIAVDDQGIRVIVPMLTTERRGQLVKLAKEKMEEAKIRVRQSREDMQNVFKELKLPEDVFRNAKEDLQKKVDETNNTLESLFKKKEGDITTE